MYRLTVTWYTRANYTFTFCLYFIRADSCEILLNTLFIFLKMSIQLKLDQAIIDQPKEDRVKLQFIPAKIEEPTEAKVDEYFNNYTTEVDGCKYPKFHTFENLYQ